MPQDYRHNWNERHNAIHTKEAACSDVEDLLICKYEIYCQETWEDIPMTFDEWLNN